MQKLDAAQSSTSTLEQRVQSILKDGVSLSQASAHAQLVRTAITSRTTMLGGLFRDWSAGCGCFGQRSVAQCVNTLKKAENTLKHSSKLMKHFEAPLERHY